MRKILISYAAGALGAIVTCFIGWFLANYGVFADFGVDVTPRLTFDWLYPPIVWGSLWGLMFVFIKMHKSYFGIAALLSLIPTLLQLFVFYPHTSVHGVEGPELNTNTAIAIALMNLLWAFITVSVIRVSHH